MIKYIIRICRHSKFTSVNTRASIYNAPDPQIYAPDYDPRDMESREDHLEHKDLQCRGGKKKTIINSYYALRIPYGNKTTVTHAPDAIRQKISSRSVHTKIRLTYV